MTDFDEIGTFYGFIKTNESDTNDCDRKPKNGGRFRFCVKGGRIDLNEGFSCAVPSEIVRDFDVEDVKKIVEEFKRLRS